MKHEKSKKFPAWPPCDYYDFPHEIPDECKVSFPDDREPKMMSKKEMRELAEKEEWWVIVHTVNWGSCDHWKSIPFKTWIDKYYPKLNQYVDRNKNTIGYARENRYVKLTKESNYWKAEVWNS